MWLSGVCLGSVFRGDGVMTFDRSLSVIAAYISIVFVAAIVLGVF